MKVSVIIPIYNVEKYLAECLESVINQTLRDIEIICVNDCSTDKSGEVMNEYANKDQRIRVIVNRKNGGLSYSRNQGLKVAKGKYICFLDSDDMLMNRALEELYCEAEKEKTDIIFFNAKMQIESEKVIERETTYCAKVNYPGVMSGVDFFMEMQRAKDVRIPVWLQFWSKLSLYEMHLEFAEGLFHEDILFTYKALMNAKRVLCLQNVYYIYRRHDNSITLGKIDERYIISLLKIYQQIMEYWYQHIDERIDSITKNYLLSVRWKLNQYIDELNVTKDEMLQVIGRDSIYANWYDILDKSEIKMTKQQEFTRAKQMIYLAKSSKVYLYGAGQAARGRILLIQKYDINIDGILVADTQSNPPYFMDIPVYSVNSILDHKDDCAVVIGVGRKLHDEVIGQLTNLGISNIVEIS